MVDKVKEKLSDIMVVRNNIAGHDYSIGNYKLSKTEAEIVVIALNDYYNNMCQMKTVNDS